MGESGRIHMSPSSGRIEVIPVNVTRLHHTVGMYNHDERTWRVVACACCKLVQGVEELLLDKDIQALVAQRRWK